MARSFSQEGVDVRRYMLVFGGSRNPTTTFAVIMVGEERGDVWLRYWVGNLSQQGTKQDCPWHESGKGAW